MNQRLDYHPCKFCLKAYDGYKIIGHLKELHKLEPDFEKEMTKLENKIKKSSPPAPAPPLDQQEEKPGQMSTATENNEFHNCKFCKTNFDGDSKLRGLYNHVKIAHPEEKLELNYLAERISKEFTVQIPDSTAIQKQIEKLKKPAGPEQSLSMYDNCTLCSCTFKGPHKKTDFYLHIKTKHPDGYHDEWEKLLQLEKNAKKNPDIALHELREQIETDGKQNTLLLQQAAQINDKTMLANFKLEKDHSNSNGQIIVEKNLDCGPKILVESELSKTTKTPISSLIDASISSMNSSTNNYPGKRRISHYSVKNVPSSSNSNSDTLAQVKNNAEKQTILPSTSTNNGLQLLNTDTDEEKEKSDKSLNVKDKDKVLSTSADKPQAPKKSANKAPQPPKKKQLKKSKQSVKKRRKRKRLSDIGNVSDSDGQSSDFEPEVKKSPSKTTKPQVNTAPEPDPELNPNNPSVSAESMTMTQQEIDDIPDPDPPVKSLRKRVKKISYDTDKFDHLEDDFEAYEDHEPRVKTPRNIINKSIPPNCNYCKEVLPERTEKSYFAHLSSGNCKGIIIKKREPQPPPVPERKDSLTLTEIYCSICTEMFKTRDNLEEHIAFEHYKYKCPNSNCSKRFLHILNLKVHLELVHQEFISPPYESHLLTKLFCKIPKLELKRVDSAQQDDLGMVRKYFNYMYNLWISTKASKVKPEMETICKVCGELVKFNTRDLKELKLHCLVHDPVYLSYETCSFCKRKFLSREQYKDHLKINHQISNFNEAPDLYFDSSNTNINTDPDPDPDPATKNTKLPRIIKPRLIKYHENSSASEVSSAEDEDSETGGSDTDFEGDFEPDVNKENENEVLVRLCHVCGITLSEPTLAYHFNLHDFDKKSVCIYCTQRYDEECKLKEHQSNCKLNPNKSNSTQSKNLSKDK